MKRGLWLILPAILIATGARSAAPGRTRDAGVVARLRLVRELPPLLAQLRDVQARALNTPLRNAQVWNDIDASAQRLLERAKTLESHVDEDRRWIESGRAARGGGRDGGLSARCSMFSAALMTNVEQLVLIVGNLRRATTSPGSWTTQGYNDALAAYMDSKQVLVAAGGDLISALEPAARSSLPAPAFDRRFVERLRLLRELPPLLSQLSAVDAFSGKASDSKYWSDRGMAAHRLVVQLKAVADHIEEDEVRLGGLRRADDGGLVDLLSLELSLLSETLRENAELIAGIVSRVGRLKAEPTSWTEKGFADAVEIDLKSRYELYLEGGALTSTLARLKIGRSHWLDGYDFHFRAAVDTDLRIVGLKVRAGGGFSVSTDSGVATLGGLARSVAAARGSLTPAAAGRKKVAICQVDDAGAVTIKYGAEAPVDGVAGASVSGPDAAKSAAGGRFLIDLDGDGAREVVLSDDSSAEAVAADIQAKVRALKARDPRRQRAYDAFTAAGRFDMWTTFQPPQVGKIVNATGAAVEGSPYATGPDPYGLAFDGARVWTTNSDGTASVLSAADGSPVGTYAVGSHPLGIAFDGKYMWIANSGDGTVTKLSASDGAKAGTFKVGAGPFGVAYDGANIWVANSRDNSVSELRAEDGALVRTLSAGYGFRTPTDLVYDGAAVWVTNPAVSTSGVHAASTVVKLSAADGSLLGTYPAGGYPSAIAFDGANIWMTDQSADSVLELKASDGSFVRKVATGAGPAGLAFDGRNIWTGNITDNTLTVISAADGAVLGTHLTGLEPALIIPAFSRYVLTSGTPGPAGSVKVASAPLDDAAAPLRLGAANGGFEGPRSVEAAYPAPDAGHLTLAYLFSPAAPITSATSAITDASIVNLVPGR
ncbi:MAG: hypothetical protein ACHQ49_02520 [Elusimicrobiota bacterium]